MIKSSNEINDLDHLATGADITNFTYFLCIAEKKINSICSKYEEKKMPLDHERLKIVSCSISHDPYTVQPHYNAPHYSAVFNMTRPCHGSQIKYFAICLL